MGLPFKLYKVLKKDKLAVTMIPGRFAGWKTSKIFGRLDCAVGKRNKKENRIFFANFKDATDAGYAPCHNCNPLPTDKYPEQEVLREELLTKVHIALWKSRPSTQLADSNRVWYVRLDWKEKNSDKVTFRKIILSDTFVYQTARAIALALGKRCNLPVLQMDSGDFTNIGIPIERTNDLDVARDHKALKDLRNAEKITVPIWML